MHATQYGRPGGFQNRNGQPKKFQGPGIPPVAKASVLRNVNFKRLAQHAGGFDALGSMLGMTVGRLKELEDGRDFNDETAFHLEHELNLPSGWFDQKNAALPAKIERLEEPEEQNFSKRLDIPRKVEQNKVLPSEPPLKAVNEAPDSGAKKESHVIATPAPTSSPSLVKSPEPLEVAPMSTSTVTDVLEAARMMRRNNLTALTSKPRSKSGLARLLQKTPANVSHLIHGEKNFDREAAREIEVVTGLPENWFEAPRTLDDVPPQIIAVLTGNAEPTVVVQNKGRKAGRPRKEVSAEEASAASAPRPRGRPRKTEVAAPAGAVTPVASAPVAPTGVIPAVGAPLKKRPGRPRRDASSDLFTAGAASAAAQAVSAPMSHAIALPVGPTASVKTMDMLRESTGKAGPIAEALVLTILEKSRTGALTEQLAFKMLSEVMAK